jgi:hypothetical protein
MALTPTQTRTLRALAAGKALSCRWRFKGGDPFGDLIPPRSCSLGSGTVGRATVVKLLDAGLIAEDRSSDAITERFALTPTGRAFV